MFKFLIIILSLLKYIIYFTNQKMLSNKTKSTNVDLFLEVLSLFDKNILETSWKFQNSN